MTRSTGRHTARIPGLVVLMMAFALPVWANNPPRPDGVVYLALVFPVALAASYFAQVTSKKRRLWARILRGVFFTVTVLLSAAGTDLGLLAMLVVVAYGLARASEIFRQKGGSKTVALGVFVVFATLAAGAGYLWALGAGSAEAYERARQRRTIADLRNTGVAVVSWSVDQVRAADESVAGSEFSARDEDSTTPASKEPETALTREAQRPVSFTDTEAPPRISQVELEALLVPDYLSDLVELDGWKNPYELRLDRKTHRFWMRSAGRDREYEVEPYVEGSFERADLDRDLVWIEGQLWRWPAAP